MRIVRTCSAGVWFYHILSNVKTGHMVLEGAANSHNNMEYKHTFSSYLFTSTRGSRIEQIIVLNKYCNKPIPKISCQNTPELV